MRDSVVRVLTLLILGALFVGLMIHYAGAAPANEFSRESVAKLGSPGDHAGEEVYVWARVQRNDDTLAVLVAGEPVTVVGAETTARPGDAVQVYGTIQSDGTVLAERVVVSEQSGLLGLYAISTVALVLVAVLFLRSWAVDTDRLAFVPRGGGRDDA